jgi:glycerol-3-phosphate dehydrogenase
MKSRAEAQRSIENQRFDLCVIGGGATGAGCALDAQLRGLHTVLIEAADFASGASGASTKIVHGGVRYLQQAAEKLDVRQYRVVKRALHERARMLANAPYLTRQLEFVIPCFSWRELVYYRAGMKIYDWMAGAAALTPSHTVARSETLRRLPALKPDGLTGAVIYSDGQFDDCRYGIALVQTFAENGGEVLNHARVVGFKKDGAGLIVAVRVRDEVGHREFSVRAKAFVNATGAAADRAREMAHPGVARRMRPSKGVHIVLPLEGSCDAALLIPSTEDGRVIFAIPWRGVLLVGTTDDAALDNDELMVTQAEADYLLRHVNCYLRRSFAQDEILSCSAGLRPLVSEAGGRKTGELIRDHEVECDQESGLISILGGKWTTYRAMAEETIDAVQVRLGVSGDCKTRNFPLSGSAGPDDWEGLTQKSGISVETALHLKQKFGSKAAGVLQIANNNLEMAEQLVEGFPAIRAEVVYCIREEMAMTIEDVLARRIGLQLLSWQASIKAALVVGKILGREFNWSQKMEEDAVSDYVEPIQRQRERLSSPCQP